MLPNFLIVGAPKTGTSSLYQYLRAHPQVFMPTPKEIRFFAIDELWEKGVQWYETFFENAGDAIAIGEACPRYATHPWTPGAERISSVIPGSKLIYVVRNPLEQIFSSYRFSIATSFDFDPIHVALRKKHFQDLNWYIAVASYAMQIEQYLDRFGRDQLLIVQSEDLKQRRTETLKGILGFLGADPTLLPDDAVQSEHNVTAAMLDARVPRKRWLKPENRASWPGYQAVVSHLPASMRNAARQAVTREARREIDPTLEAELKAELTEQLRPDIRRLATYMEPDFDGWGLI